MDQISGTTPTDAPAQAPDQSPPAAAANGTGSPEPPGFQPRGRARRRARFLRKARELAYRDLGGLVFNLHRFGQRNDALVLAKLNTLGQIDAELRAIEGALGERRPITVLREAGITACARCAAIHSSEDNFCPNCGLSMGRHVDLPIGGAAAPPTPQPVPSAPATPAAAAQPAASAPAPAAAAAAAPAPNPPAPGRAPTPARVPDLAGATSAPASSSPPSAAPVGRSPAPPSAAGTQPSTPPAPAREAPIEEDRPTEILRPPVSGS